MDALASPDLRTDLVSLVNVLFGVTAPTAQPASTTAELPEPAGAQQAPSAVEMPSIEVASTPAPIAIPVPALAVPHWEDSPAETQAAPTPASIPLPELSVEQPKVSTKRSMALLNEIGFLDD